MKTRLFLYYFLSFFFFNDTATTEIYTLSLHDALPILRKASGQDYDRYGADRGTDHPEPALAQRSSELRLAHNRRGGAGPKGIVEFEPERNEESEAERRPEAKCVQQRGGGLRRLCE